jgi:hypothetical protein
VVTIDSSLRTSDGEVFMAAGDARTLENWPNRYLDDISDDEESANAPPTRLPKTRTRGVSATGSEPIDADVSGKLSPSGTLTRLWTKSSFRGTHFHNWWHLKFRVEIAQKCGQLQSSTIH